MARARCSRCGAAAPRKTSTETLCDSCEAEDRAALTAALNYLKLCEDFSCTQYELSSLDDVDEQRLRRWLRMGIVEKCGTGQVCLCSQLKKSDRRPPAILLQRLLAPETTGTHDLRMFEPKMAAEELVIVESD